MNAIAKWNQLGYNKLVMEEDYMATTRNGHNLKDMYNPETNTLDIRSNGLYPSNALRNLCSNGFRFEGMVCGTMEGLLPFLKRGRNSTSSGRYAA